VTLLSIISDEHAAAIEQLRAIAGFSDVLLRYIAGGASLYHRVLACGMCVSRARMRINSAIR
jgi:hypothetical protein